MLRGHQPRRHRHGRRQDADARNGDGVPCSQPRLCFNSDADGLGGRTVCDAAGDNCKAICTTGHEYSVAEMSCKPDLDDTQNCGSLNQVCPNPTSGHGQGVCSSGACAFQCDSGYSASGPDCVPGGPIPGSTVTATSVSTVDPPKTVTEVQTIARPYASAAGGAPVPRPASAAAESSDTKAASKADALAISPIPASSSSSSSSTSISSSSRQPAISDNDVASLRTFSTSAATSSPSRPPNPAAIGDPSDAHNRFAASFAGATSSTLTHDEKAAIIGGTVAAVLVIVLALVACCKRRALQRVGRRLVDWAESKSDGPVAAGAAGAWEKTKASMVAKRDSKPPHRFNRRNIRDWLARTSGHCTRSQAQPAASTHINTSASEKPVRLPPPPEKAMTLPDVDKADDRQQYIPPIPHRQLNHDAMYRERPAPPPIVVTSARNGAPLPPERVERDESVWSPRHSYHTRSTRSQHTFRSDMAEEELGGGYDVDGSYAYRP